MAEKIACWSLLFSGISFVLFLVAMVLTLIAQLRAQSVPESAQKSAVVDSFTKLVEAVANLVDKLTKAPPAVVALAASIIFMGIAAYSATPPPVAENPKSSATSNSTTP